MWGRASSASSTYPSNPSSTARRLLLRCRLLDSFCYTSSPDESRHPTLLWTDDLNTPMHRPRARRAQILRMAFKRRHSGGEYKVRTLLLRVCSTITLIGSAAAPCLLRRRGIVSRDERASRDRHHRRRFAFVGDPTLCLSSCTAQQDQSPNGNPSADGMCNIIAHEVDEAASDPGDLITSSGVAVSTLDSWCVRAFHYWNRTICIHHEWRKR